MRSAVTADSEHMNHLRRTGLALLAAVLCAASVSPLALAGESAAA